jgi:hypothetical protein
MLKKIQVPFSNVSVTQTLRLVTETQRRRLAKQRISAFCRGLGYAQGITWKWQA